MKVIISPAKSLDFENKAPTAVFTEPQFIAQSKKISRVLKPLSTKDLETLMHISPALSNLNFERNQTWQPPFTPNNAKQAIYAFTGAVFQGINAQEISEEKIPALQNTLRIISGLYGLLRPLDLIQPYRLEMGTKLKVAEAKNLYQFWGNTLANHLNNELEDGEVLVNLASKEYFKAVPAKALKTPLITPIFKELKNGEYKIVMTYAKKARGLMTRYIIDNNCKTIDDLKGFNTANYRFSEQLSSGNDLVFTR